MICRILFVYQDDQNFGEIYYKKDQMDQISFEVKLENVEVVVEFKIVGSE